VGNRAEAQPTSQLSGNRANISLVFVIDKYICVRFWVPLLETLAITPKTMTFHTNCCSLQRPIVYTLNKVAPLNPAAQRRSALEVRSCVPCDQPSIRISPDVCRLSHHSESSLHSAKTESRRLRAYRRSIGCSKEDRAVEMLERHVDAQAARRCRRADSLGTARRYAVFGGSRPRPPVCLPAVTRTSKGGSQQGGREA
jgi:hypothetical protein